MIRHLTTRSTAFDPDVVQILSRALDDAWEIVLADKIGFKLNGNAEAVRDVLAKHIVDLALRGERDGQRLINGALNLLKL
jgi:hypothetical protein